MLIVKSFNKSYRWTNLLYLFYENLFFCLTDSIKVIEHSCAILMNRKMIQSMYVELSMVILSLLISKIYWSWCKTHCTRIHTWQLCVKLVRFLWNFIGILSPNSLYPYREYINFGQEFATHHGRHRRPHKVYIYSKSTSPEESI